MQVLARYSAAVLDLAARHPGADESFRRVLNYARIQKAWCAWGLAPGAVRDETSPFNACSHAYLAATRDLLLRMSAPPSRPRAVDDLAREIDAEMMANGAALLLCRFSGEVYDTATTLTPDWRAALRHPTSVASLAGLLLAILAVPAGVRRLLRRRAMAA